MDKNDATHACRGRVGSTNGSYRGIDNLAQAGGPGLEICDDPADIIEKIVHVCGEANALAVLVPECLLQETEKAA